MRCKGEKYFTTGRTPSRDELLCSSQVSHDLVLKSQTPVHMTQTKPRQHDCINISDHLHNLSYGNYLDPICPDAVWLSGSWNRLSAFVLV